MKLTTEIKQCNLGMIKSDLAWQLFFNLELTPEETEIIKTYQLRDRTLCKFPDMEGNDHWLDIKDVVNGKGGTVYKDLNQIYYLRQLLVEGCERLRDYLRQLLELGAGGGKKSYEFHLHKPNVEPAALAAPPPIPQP